MTSGLVRFVGPKNQGGEVAEQSIARGGGLCADHSRSELLATHQISPGAAISERIVAAGWPSLLQAGCVAQETSSRASKTKPR